MPTEWTGGHGEEALYYLERNSDLWQSAENPLTLFSSLPLMSPFLHYPHRQWRAPKISIWGCGEGVDLT